MIRLDSNAKICLPGEFWLGNDILSKLSNEGESMLRVRLYLSKLFNLLYVKFELEKANLNLRHSYLHKS